MTEKKKVELKDLGLDYELVPEKPRFRTEATPVAAPPQQASKPVVVPKPAPRPVINPPKAAVVYKTSDIGIYVIAGICAMVCVLGVGIVLLAITSRTTSGETYNIGLIQEQTVILNIGLSMASTGFISHILCVLASLKK